MGFIQLKLNNLAVLLKKLGVKAQSDGITSIDERAEIGENEVRMATSESHLFDQECAKQLVKKSFRKKEEVNCQTTNFPMLLPETFTKESIELQETLVKSSNDEIFESKIVKYLIDFKWNQFVWLCRLEFAVKLFYLSQLVIFFLPQRVVSKEYVNEKFLSATCLLLLVFEILQLFTLGLVKYFLSSNAVELITYSLTLGLLFSSQEHDQDTSSDPSVLKIIVFLL